MITIVDYNAGNLRSVKRACDAVGIESVFTSDADRVADAERIIFPGVGHAKSCMQTLNRLGLDGALETARRRGVPILGICVGAQLMLEGSDEGPVTALGWFPGRTQRITPDQPSLKVPHIGWNDVQVVQPHPLLDGMGEEPSLYFVHSYYMAPTEPEVLYAQSDYGSRFCCALGRDNVFAVQFHPEKSGRLGLALLERFATWRPPTC